MVKRVNSVLNKVKHFYGFHTAHLNLHLHLMCQGKKSKLTYFLNLYSFRMFPSHPYLINKKNQFDDLQSESELLY